MSPSNATYLSAAQAAERLGITKATLYAYVSRGLIRSIPGEGSSRARRYATVDVDALISRKQVRRDPGSAAATALDFGEPVLASAMTLIQDGRLYYRGLDATELAVNASFPAVARLLWHGKPDASPFRLDPIHAADAAAWLGGITLPNDLSALERLQALLPLAQARDPQAYLPTPALIEEVGIRAMQLLITVTATLARSANSELDTRRGSAIDHTLVPAAQFAQIWQIALPNAASLLDAALILSADHEFNISSFTARCVASAGATPYAALSAALGAMQGTRHGGQSLRCTAFLREVAREGPQVVRARLRRGENLPGFGHRLYPDGDPRGRYLIDLARSVPGDPDTRSLIDNTLNAVQRQTGLQANIDFGLVALARVLDLPDDAPLILFTMGRIAGWVGQIIEQTATGQLIRPRANYTGPLPVTTGGTTAAQ